MRVEIIGGGGIVRGWIEPDADGFLASRLDCLSTAIFYRDALAVERGAIRLNLESGVPELVGELPSPEDTLQFMLTQPHLAGRIRKATVGSRIRFMFRRLSDWARGRWTQVTSRTLGR
jgi:hypothetical protein